MKIALPIVLWALHFTAIYGFTALACARGFGAAVPWAVGAATAIAAVLAIVLIITNLKSDFNRWMTAGVAGFALVAIVLEGLPALMVPVCA